MKCSISVTCKAIFRGGQGGNSSQGREFQVSVEEGRILTVVLAIGRFVYKRLMIMKRHSRTWWERGERSKAARRKMSQVDLRIRKSEWLPGDLSEDHF